MKTPPLNPTQKTIRRNLLCALPLLGAALISLGGCNSAPPTAETAAAPTSQSAAAPITIGYSDWPGWVAWDIAEQKGFFKKQGVEVKLTWFPVYTDSLNAFAAGQVDGNCQTWGDSMGPMAQGVKMKAVLVNDNSAGNDAMLAQPGITSVKQLKGKKVATELGTVDHFLMLKALEANGLKESDVKFVNIKVQDCPAAMLSKQVDAAVVWEPSLSKILKEVKGSKNIFDSSDVPGAIPDLLVFKSEVVETRGDEVQKIINAWFEAIDWWRANPKEAVKIMAARTDTPVADYEAFIKGTRIFSAPEAAAAMQKSSKPTSLYVSGESVAQFLLKAKQIPAVPDYAAAIEPKFVTAAAEAGLGKKAPYDYK
jgi:NitT/TauT family transport system substrate-binding protein